MRRPRGALPTDVQRMVCHIKRHDVKADAWLDAHIDTLMRRMLTARGDVEIFEHRMRRIAAWRARNRAAGMGAAAREVQARYG